MSDELKAARERLWRIKLGEDIDDVYQHSPFLSPEDKWDNDRMLLSDEYLIEHPADDDEPVTAEWLDRHRLAPLVSSCGAEAVVGFDVLRSYHGFYVLRWAGTWQCVVIDDISGSELALSVVTTRGDVRRLCRALGVPLEEQ